MTQSQTSFLIAENRKARFEYDIHERLEAGLALTGLEIKALRAKRADISASYARVVAGEVWLINANFSDGHVTEPTRSRKLLLHKSEIARLIGLSEQKGHTIIPLNIHWKRGKAKVELGVGVGRKMHDKRAVLKKRDIAREQSRGLT